MNRSAVKNFAQWARRNLHDVIGAQLARFGVTEKGIETPSRIEGGLRFGGDLLNLSATDIGQYDALIQHYHSLSGTPKEKFNLLLDEIAYTWFNRLAALRYMEVHDYTSRTLSSGKQDDPEPQLLTDALNLAATGELGEQVTPDVVGQWQDLYERGETYRRLLAAKAATFAQTMPFLFSREKAWIDLMLPSTLLNQDSIVRRMVADIPEADWQDIEIVGWLYQFYISERKDEVFAQKGKYTPRDIPAATQLFTPHWIVRYMVENSLGRVWLEAHPESGLKAHMPYYLDSENPAPEPQPDLKPEDLTVMDPACGSGHILVYAFDLLAHIYREQGYSDREIPALILTHNLHGLDIDERAAQLASFAVVMKARELNSRLLRRDMPPLNILQVKSTRGLALPNSGGVDMFGRFSAMSDALTDADAFNPNDWQPLLSAFADADHLGSLITPPAFDAERLRAQLHWLEQRGGLDTAALDDLRHLLKQAELLAKKYDAVVANPPYIGNRNMSQKLRDLIEEKYADFRSDTFAAFVAHVQEMNKLGGSSGFMTPYVWMFISTYEPLRKLLTSESSISSLIQLEYSGFDGATVPICTFTTVKSDANNRSGTFISLSGFKGSDAQEPNAIAGIKSDVDYKYKVPLKVFSSLPGNPIAFTAGQGMLKTFRLPKRLGDISKPSSGIDTGGNERYLRAWYEVVDPISNYNKGATKWRKYNKGGDFRKWYGNRYWVVNWRNDGYEIRKQGNIIGESSSNLRNMERQMMPGIGWSSVSSSYFSARYFDEGFMFDNSGPTCFSGPEKYEWLIALLCSNYARDALNLLNPTLHYQPGNLSNLPVIEKIDIEAVAHISAQALDTAKTDWDNFETSWDFQTHPLLRSGVPTLTEAFARWEAQSEAAFRELQRLEEENNRYWIDAYGLADELTPEVPDDQITIRRADLGRDVRSLLSYAVGCMMGRYSLDEPGLIHAGQPFDASRHQKFAADKDGILPVTTESYFDDDVTTRFREFLRVAFGPEALDANMDWVAASLGGQKAGETAEDRIRRYFATEFMSDHIQTYKKRPIYWLFTSGKKRGFGALVYLHRYGPDTLARLRTEYLMPLQRTLDAGRERAKAGATHAVSTADKKKAEKRMKDLEEQIAEVHRYDESLKHAADLRIPLDLDDGVAYNYWLMSAAGQDYLTARLTGKGLKGGQDLVYSGTDLKLADLEKKSQWKRDLLAQEAGA